MLQKTEEVGKRRNNRGITEVSKKRSLLRNPMLLAISLTVFASFSGLGMVNTVRVLYAQSHGASLGVISAMASAYLIANFMFQYPAGWVADRWGRRQVMIVGLTAQAVLTLVYLFINDPITFIGLRFIEGIAAAGIVPSARALVTDSIPTEQQGEAFGIFNAFFNAGFLLGPGIGGLLATTGFASAFIGAVLFRLAAIVLLLTIVRAAGKTKQTPVAGASEAILRPGTGALANPLAGRRKSARVQLTLLYKTLLTLPLLGAYLIIFGDFLYLGFDQTLLPIWLHDHLGANVAMIGLVYIAWSIPNILLSPLSGRVADRRQRSLLILIFGLAQIPIYIGYGLANTVIIVLILSVIHGVVYAFIQPALDSHVAASSPVDARAQVQGFYAAVGFIGAFIGASGFTPLYAINFRLPLFIMAAVFGVCVLIGSALIRLSEKKKVHIASPEGPPL
ncbi:MAG: MFS transporter [Ktedonobacteraceae bacterium]|nr:MFS transporter [Ktedonobacteraceae bacterium]